MTTHLSLLSWAALAFAAISTVLLVGYLVRRPPLTPVTRLFLLAALGVFPIGLAATGNVAGYERTKERSFCGSCHVMIPHASDSNDPTSMSLAARHGRNKLFGQDNCYVCHADYAMYGTITTKLGGMKHVWMYYTEYRNVPLEEAKKTIHLYNHTPNDNS